MTGDQARQIQVIVFKLGDVEFAVPIVQAVRIVRLSPITRVPRAPSFLEGVINVEGDIIPVVDLKKRFSLAHAPFGPKARVLVVEAGEQPVGMLVDRVREILLLPPEAIESPPAMIADINGVFLTGVARLKDRLLIILDLVNVLSLEEIETLAGLEEVVEDEIVG